VDDKIDAFQAKLAELQRSVREEQAATAAEAEAAAAAAAAAEAEAGAAAGAEAVSGAATPGGDVGDKIEAFQAKLAELQRSVREEQAAQGAAPEGPAPDVEQPKAPDE